MDIRQLLGLPALWPLLANFFTHQAPEIFQAHQASIQGETGTVDGPRYAEAFKLLATRQLHFSRRLFSVREMIEGLS